MWLIIDFLLDMFVLKKIEDEYHQGRQPFPVKTTFIITVMVIATACVYVVLTK